MSPLGQLPWTATGPQDHHGSVAMPSKPQLRCLLRRGRGVLAAVHGLHVELQLDGGADDGDAAGEHVAPVEGVVTLHPTRSGASSGGDSRQALTCVLYCSHLFALCIFLGAFAAPQALPGEPFSPAAPQESARRTGRLREKAAPGVNQGRPVALAYGQRRPRFPGRYGSPRRAAYRRHSSSIASTQVAQARST